MPLVSVILPVRNGALYLKRSLPAIRASSFRDYELIVVDDGSTDPTPDILKTHAPDTLLTNAQSLGAFASRNRGAAHARGRILVFVDADVVIHPETLARIAEQLRDGTGEALIGVYSLSQPNRNLCSIYKNAWIRFSYLAAPDTVSWFFTAIGAVRREAWDRYGPFDSKFEPRYGGGDIEFGQRLSRQGVCIALDKRLEVTHLKTFSLRALLLNDLRRAMGYTRLTLRSRRPGLPRANGIANVSNRFLAGVVLATAGLLSSALAIVVHELWALALVIGLLWVGVNASFLRYFAKHVSPALALAIVPIMFVDQLFCAVGATVGVWQYRRSARAA
ncbi:MAG TPA: glycosyltransferase [Candidatus Methylomirabilis sp.]|nr:glycosyltransferase [Candidatus Methylomirabilis sp.]